MRHCIVSPEFEHLHRNGGCGTDSYYLAQFLSRVAGEEVTILYTREADNLPHWKELIQRECGARFVALNETEEVSTTRIRKSSEPLISLRVYGWLREQDFDVIHFQHCSAAGFSSIQAKRLGEAFENTHLITIAHSPSQWVNQAQQQHPSGEVFEMILDYMERYCAQYCDTLVSASHHLITWMRDAGWTLAPDVRVIPGFLPPPQPISVPPLDPTHLVFLDRLETRKGIQIFTEAAKAYGKWLRELPAPDGNGERRRFRLSYLGQNGQVLDDNADTYLANALKGTAEIISWEIMDELGHREALDFSERNAHALYVFPAAMDNFPFALYEGMVRGLHQIASSQGGIGEFFSGENCKFDPTVEGLFEKLKQIYLHGLPPAEHAFTREQAASLRLDFIRELQSKIRSSQLAPSTAVSVSSSEPNSQPLISVCIPHYNAGDYLPACLECLTQQTYPNFEVIVVDDGSTCEKSLAVFAAMQALYKPRHWKFINKPHSGTCETRNLAVEHSSGDLIAFVDADNLPRPAMLQVLQNGLHKAALDCITCNLHSFQDGKSSQHLSLYWAFLGGCPEASLFMNTLGDANMLVRKPVFKAVGGFREPLVTVGRAASEDLMLLVRIAIAGYRMDCSSSILLAYRHRSGSASAKANKYWQRVAILNAFTEGMEPWMKNLFLHQFGDPTRVKKETSRIRAKLQQYREKYHAEREKRRERERNATVKKNRLLMKIRSSRYLGSIIRAVKGKR